MSIDEEACDIARGLIDIELGLCYSREEAEPQFEIGSNEDPLV